MKVVINKCFGVFGLSELAYAWLGIEWDGYGYHYAGDRTDSRLVAVVEDLGSKASGSCAGLVVVTIPDDVSFYIEDYDGIESIHETHRIWS